MLDNLRRHRESYAAKFLLGALALSFVIGFGVLPSLNDNSANGTVVARVDGKPIYRTELDQVVLNMTERYRAQFGAQLDDNLLKQLNLEQMALQTLINRRVLLNEAEKTGMAVTDDDLRDFLMKNDAFKNENGVFDPKMYERAIRGAGRGLTPAKFESSTRESMVIERMQALIDQSVMLTDDQIREIYIAENEKANLAYVSVSAQDVADSVKVGKEDMQAYYEAHKAEFAVPETRKFKYVELSPAGLAPSQEVSESELRAAYEKRKGEFNREEEVRASHILFKGEGADIRKKAEDAAAQARAGKDFAELAKKLSEDSSAANGGDLGFFGRNRMVKPFEDKAFAMKVGEISEPVQSQFGWHVIKVTEKKEAGPMPFDEVKTQLEREAKMEKASAALPKLVEAVEKELQGGADLEAVAAKNKLLVEETDFVAKSGSIPGVLDAKALLDAGYALNEGATSKVVESGGVKYALKAVGVQAARQRTLAEVEGQVTAALKNERAATLAAARAAEILDQAKKSKSLAKAAGKLEVKETGLFAQITGEVPTIGKDPDLFRTAFSLRTENPLPDRTFAIGDKYYVIQLKDREHADPSKFAAERERIIEERLKDKREAVFSEWLQSARSRTKIENLMESEAKLPAAIPGMPGQGQQQGG